MRCSREKGTIIARVSVGIGKKNAMYVQKWGFTSRFYAQLKFDSFLYSLFVCLVFEDLNCWKDKVELLDIHVLLHALRIGASCRQSFGNWIKHCAVGHFNWLMSKHQDDLSETIGSKCGMIFCLYKSLEVSPKTDNRFLWCNKRSEGPHFPISISRITRGITNKLVWLVLVA